ARVEDVLTNRRFARHRPAPRLRAVSATFGAKAVVSAISFTACIVRGLQGPQNLPSSTGDH
ncbi:MAG: hypothetical protein KDJ86_05380, partial [Bauldia sp.]|uniref:hypothetical protein n=1 Tax=Bauldia sp. TaxID=2575872 RepID=UPI001DE94ADC